MNAKIADCVATLAVLVLRDRLDEGCVALANALVDLGADASFILVIAGANLDNLPAVRRLALEELERLL